MQNIYSNRSESNRIESNRIVAARCRTKREREREGEREREKEREREREGERERERERIEKITDNTFTKRFVRDLEERTVGEEDREYSLHRERHLPSNRIVSYRINPQIRFEHRETLLSRTADKHYFVRSLFRLGLLFFLFIPSYRSSNRRYNVTLSIDHVPGRLIAVSFFLSSLSGKEKLGVPQNENVSVVLESDGTQVEDGEYFKTLANNTILLLLRHGERWCPTGVDIIRAGTYSKNNHYLPCISIKDTCWSKHWYFYRIFNDMVEECASLSINSSYFFL